MKKINWKFIIFTCMICLMPICLGLFFYEELPETMAVHFNIENEADNFASKNFTLFGIPLIMVTLQIFCCMISDINENKRCLGYTFVLGGIAIIGAIFASNKVAFITIMAMCLLVFGESVYFTFKKD